MYDLDKKIDEYSDELFTDLKLSALSEEGKADLYARVQEHLHRVILKALTPVVGSEEASRIHTALEQEDYHALERFLKKYPEQKENLEKMVEQEFSTLKLTIAEEQKNAGRVA